VRSSRRGAVVGLRSGGRQAAAAVERHEMLASEGEGIDLELGHVRARYAAIDAESPSQPDERAEAAQQLAVGDDASVTAHLPRDHLIGRGLAEELEELLGAGLGRDGLGDGDARLHDASEVFRIDAAQAPRRRPARTRASPGCQRTALRRVPARRVRRTRPRARRRRLAPRAAVEAINAVDLALHRVIEALRAEDDALRVGFVHDILRDDLEHDLLAGERGERLLGDEVVDGQEHVLRRRDRADELHDLIDLVLVTAVDDPIRRPPSAAARPRGPRRRRGDRRARRHVEHRAVPWPGGGEVSVLSVSTQCRTASRRAAAIQPRMVRRGRAAAEAQSSRPASNRHRIALAGEHLADRFSRSSPLRAEEACDAAPSMTILLGARRSRRRGRAAQHRARRAAGRR
jgi:hypothetical protein